MALSVFGDIEQYGATLFMVQHYFNVAIFVHCWSSFADVGSARKQHWFQPRQTRDADSLTMLSHCWTGDTDVLPALNNHRVNLWSRDYNS